MKDPGRVLRLSIFVGESDGWHHRSLYSEIVRRAHRAGLPGATVLRGVEGFGANSRIHTTHAFRLSQDMPMLIVIAADEERIRAFLPQLDDLDLAGLVVLDEVEVRQPRGDRS